MTASDKYLPIPSHLLHTQVNRGVHIAWSKNAIYRLKEVDGETATCVSPTGRVVNTHVDYLRYSRRNEPKY